MDKCYVCDETQGLWLVYPFMGNNHLSQKLCKEHIKLMEKDPEGFKKLLPKGSKKGRK